LLADGRACQVVTIQEVLLRSFQIESRVFTWFWHCGWTGLFPEAFYVL